jgi:hypothetical protein
MSAIPANEKYIPRPDGLNALFYRQISSSGQLKAQRCLQCATIQHPPRYRCTACGSDKYEWADSAGHGEVISWVTTHRDVALGWAHEIPYTTVIAKIDEGFAVMGALRGRIEGLKIGAPVQVTIEPVTDAFARIWLEITSIE